MEKIKRGRNARKTTEEFRQEVYDLAGDEYTLVSEYINCNTKVKMRHNKCGNIYEVNPNKFQQGRRCPKCQHRSTKKTLEEFKQEVHEFFPDIEVLDKEYKTTGTSMNFKCLNCNNTFTLAPVRLLSKERKESKVACTHCRNTKFRKDRRNKFKKQFEDEFKKEENKDYVLLSEYINCDTKVKIKHLRCGHIYKATPEKFLQGRRCPKCPRSVAEEKIAKWLDDHNINYEIEKRFKDCRDKNPLPFDFYLEDYNLLIEFDGKQHYHEADFGYGSMGLSKYQHHDEIKTKYCKDNNYNLLRITYKQFDTIEKVLNKYFKTHKPIKN